MQPYWLPAWHFRQMPQIFRAKEYPRPQFERTAWVNLNGEWDYTFDFANSGMEQEYHKATSFSGKITVPFCPESSLSGVGHKDFINHIWYHREISIPQDWAARMYC